MDDSDAFERQVAGEMMRRAGRPSPWTTRRSGPRSSRPVPQSRASRRSSAPSDLSSPASSWQPWRSPADRGLDTSHPARIRRPRSVAPHRAHRHRQFCPCRRLTLLRFRRPQLRRRQSARLRPVSRPPSSSGPSSTRSRMACHRVRRLEDTEVFALLVGDEYGREVSPRLFGQVQVNAKENGDSGHADLIADVTDADVSTCSLENLRRAYGVVGHGPAAFLDSLQETGGLRLEGQAATTFGGRPAIAASTVWSRCAHTEIIIGTRPIWEAYARLEIPSRIIVAEVGNSTVIAQVAGQDTDRSRGMAPQGAGVHRLDEVPRGWGSRSCVGFAAFAPVIRDRHPVTREALHCLCEPSAAEPVRSTMGPGSRGGLGS